MTEPEIAVRAATENDFAFVSQDGHLSDAVVKRKVADGDAFVAFREGQPVGYLRLEWLWSRLPYIEMVWVQVPYRHSGVGRALLARAEAEVAGRGHAALLSSSQADEPGSQAWHRRMGFGECGLLAGLNEGGVGEVFFRKVLVPTRRAVLPAVASRREASALLLRAGWQRLHSSDPPPRPQLLAAKRSSDQRRDPSPRSEAVWDGRTVSPAGGGREGGDPSDHPAPPDVRPPPQPSPDGGGGLPKQPLKMTTAIRQAGGGVVLTNADRKSPPDTTPPVDDPFPILYQQIGAYDADFQVRVEADGTLTVEGGSYVTRGRRAGRLGRHDLERLRHLAAAVEAREWGAPDGAEGFTNTLALGGRSVTWWGPAADVDPHLAALVRALGTL